MDTDTAPIVKERLNQIPVIFARGDNYSVGFTIGRQMRSLIEDCVSKNDYLTDTLLPEYESEAGQILYAKQLEHCKRKFPEYVREIEGMAEGSRVPFHKLFLLNLEVFLTSFTEVVNKRNTPASEGLVGCTSLLSNGKELLLGHTEDAGPELLNNVFIVSAEVVDNNGCVVENFSSLTYAGCLPGYTMGYNGHGIVYSVNTLYPLKPLNTKTPRGFIARAVLKARSVEEVVQILKDKGTGISDGFSLNLILSNEKKAYNIEICPNPDTDESLVNLLELKDGETYVHCNVYRRHQPACGELPRAHNSSGRRHEAIMKHPKPELKDVICNIVSDTSDPEYAIFRYGDKKNDQVVTVAAGIFDIAKRRWDLYTEPPNNARPVASLPLHF